MNTQLSPHLRPRHFQWAFPPILCIFILLAMAACGGGSSAPAMDPTSNTDNQVGGEPNQEIPPEEIPGTGQPDDSSQFTGKLSFSSVLGWPVNIFNFSTNTFDLSLEADPMKEFLVQADLDPDSNYIVYGRAFLDGLLSGKNRQVVLRDLTTEQEFTLPFDTGDPAQLLNSSSPSVSSTGIAVFERYTQTINSAGLPDDEIAEGISYWNGSGQPVALAASIPEPSKPRISQDGNTVFFVAESNGERALWKTSLAADAPVTVWAPGPGSGESLVANSLPIYDLSNDGSTVAYGVIRDGVLEVHYSTPTRSGVFESTDPDPLARIQSFGLSGDGSTLIVTSFSSSDDTTSLQTITPKKLHVVNLVDGSSRIAEDSSLPGSNFFPLTSIPAVSFDGKAVAIVNTEPEPAVDAINLLSLFVFKPGEFDKAQRIIRDSDYGGLTSVTLSMRFRGGVK